MYNFLIKFDKKSMAILVLRLYMVMDVWKIANYKVVYIPYSLK